MVELGRLAVAPEPDVQSPQPEAVRRALGEVVRFMGVDTPTPCVVPTLDGGVQFVWHKGGWDVEVEVEVGPNDTISTDRSRPNDLETEPVGGWRGSVAGQRPRSVGRP